MSVTSYILRGACLLLVAAGMAGCGLVQHQNTVIQPERLYSPETPVQKEVYSDSDSVLEEVYRTEDLRLP